LASAARAVKTKARLALRSRIGTTAAQDPYSIIKFIGSDVMSIFGKIMSAIFGTSAGAATPGTTPAAGGSAPAAGSTAAPTATIDVAPILDKAVADKGEKLEWKTSIVDLLKALDIDSSLTARKELAKEFGYTGDTSDSATMNIWLHKQVMTKLAANGGKLPADIKH
jgi:hypothetical protein